MKLTAAEIEQHYEDSIPVEDGGLYFQEPAQDEVIEEAYDTSKDDWLFDDYWLDVSGMSDRYDDPYPHEDDFY